MERDLTELGAYISELCQQRGWSMRRASMEAGLAPDAISKMLRRGESQPRTSTLLQLAMTLNGDYARMMRLAGHVPADEAHELGDVVFKRKVQRVAEILEALPEDLRYQFVESVIVQAEAARAVYEASARYAAEDTTGETVTESKAE